MDVVENRLKKYWKNKIEGLGKCQRRRKKTKKNEELEEMRRNDEK